MRALSQPTTSRRELERGLRAAVGLAPPSECAAEVAAGGLVEPPAELLGPVEDARAELDDAIATMKIGRFEAATERLDVLVGSDAAQAFEPFALEVGLWQANLAEHGGRYAEAERRYGDVVYRGQAIGHDQLAWLAMYGLVAVRADRLQRPAEAAELLRQAWAMVQRLHNPRFWVGFFEMRGIVAQAQSRLLDAEVDFRTARALALQHYGPSHLRVAEVDLNLGVALVRRRERDAARPILQELLAIFERQLGRDEDDAVVGRSLLAGVAFHDGDLDTAEREWTAVLQSRVRLLGAEHPRVLLSYRNLAQVAFARGDLERTSELLDHALAIGRAREPTGGPLTRGTLFLLAQLYQRRGDGAAARARLEEAVASLGDRVDDQALMALRGLAVKQRECGAFDEAQRLLDRAAAILRATQAGPVEELAPDVALLERARGHHDVARQRLHDGITALSEPATLTADRVALRARLQLSSSLLELDLGRCDAAIAAAQERAGGDRPRAQRDRLAAAARDLGAGAGPRLSRRCVCARAGARRGRAAARRAGGAGRRAGGAARGGGGSVDRRRAHGRADADRGGGGVRPKAKPGAARGAAAVVGRALGRGCPDRPTAPRGGTVRRWRPWSLVARGAARRCGRVDRRARPGVPQSRRCAARPRAGSTARPTASRSRAGLLGDEPVDQAIRAELRDARRDEADRLDTVHFSVEAAARPVHLPPPRTRAGVPLRHDDPLSAGAPRRDRGRGRHGSAKFDQFLNICYHRCMAVRRRLVLRPADAGRVLSPVRLELLSAIGLHGPCSARELATRLGRSVTSLYYHLGLLALGAMSQRRRGSETVWQVTAQEVTVGSRRSVAAGIATAASTKAALRLTSREVEAALRDPSLRRGEPSRRLVAARSKTGSTRRG
ncbi:MAG: tetratricopeptide repeat protein [Nannocystaceae bacterium]